MKTTREITIKIPLLLAKEGNNYLISCRALSMYIQAESPAKARQEFELLFNLFADKLIKKGSFINFFKSRNLIERDCLMSVNASTSQKINSVDVPELTLGNYSDLSVSLSLNKAA